MSGPPSTSIGRKIVLTVGVPMLVAALVGAGISWLKAQEILRQSAAEEATLLADVVATSFELALEGEQPEARGHGHIGALLESEHRLLESVQALRVVDDQGIIRWSRHPAEQGGHVADAQRLLATPPEGAMFPESGEYVRPLGGQACARCHGDKGARRGAVQVSITKPRQVEDVGRFFTAVLAFTALLAAALILATGLALRRTVTRPIARLVEVMHRAEKGDFFVRAEAESRDEIGHLSGAFNSMLAKITELKVAEIETGRELESMQRELVLKAELERRVQEVTLLLDVARSLNSTLELSEILNRVTEMVGVRMKMDQFAVMLLDAPAAKLDVAASFGLDKEKMAGFRLSLGEGASGIAAKTRETLYVPDIHSDGRWVVGPQDPKSDTSALCVPLVWKEEVVGVLNFVRFAKAAFSENDIVLLQLVASHAAMAIVNARLFSETKELTLTDALTGVFNRRHLFSRLELEVARAQRFGSPLSVAMVDIDHFKRLNDTHGHPAGDEVLKLVASLLQGAVRKVDTVARYGGEEFMVLLPRSERDEAFEVAEELRLLIAQTAFPHADQQPGGRITVSIGVASFQRDGESIEALVDAVDAALYASKRGGRNKVSLYERGMEAQPGREPGPETSGALPAGSKQSAS